MNKIFSKLIVCIIVASMLAATFALTGCGEAFLYDNADKYIAGNQEYNIAEINKVEIDWISGNVNVIEYDGESLLIEEENSSDKEEYKMYSLLEDGELKVKYCKSGTLTTGGSKTLTVKIPSGKVFDEFSVDVTSADVNIAGLYAGEVDFESTSGTSNLVISANKVDVKTTSGDIKLATDASDIEIESTSGNKTILVPAEVGFTAQIETNSGEFTSSLPLVKSDDTYTYLDGKTNIKVESTSGDVVIGLIENNLD